MPPYHPNPTESSAAPFFSFQFPSFSRHTGASSPASFLDLIWEDNPTTDPSKFPPPTSFTFTRSAQLVHRWPQAASTPALRPQRVHERHEAFQVAEGGRAEGGAESRMALQQRLVFIRVDPRHLKAKPLVLRGGTPRRLEEVSRMPQELLQLWPNEHDAEETLVL